MFSACFLALTIHVLFGVQRQHKTHFNYRCKRGHNVIKKQIICGENVLFMSLIIMCHIAKEPQVRARLAIGRFSGRWV